MMKQKFCLQVYKKTFNADLFFLLTRLNDSLKDTDDLVFLADQIKIE